MHNFLLPGGGTIGEGKKKKGKKTQLKTLPYTD